MCHRTALSLRWRAGRRKGSVEISADAFRWSIRRPPLTFVYVEGFVSMARACALAHGREV
eukprot:2947253-Pyramimonas_sp.AAC.1